MPLTVGEREERALVVGLVEEQKMLVAVWVGGEEEEVMWRVWFPVGVVAVEEDGLWTPLGVSEVDLSRLVASWPTTGRMCSGSEGGHRGPVR